MTNHLSFLNTSISPLTNDPFECKEWCIQQLQATGNSLTAFIGFSVIMQILAIFFISYFPAMNPFFAKRGIIIPYRKVYKIAIAMLWGSMALQAAFIVLSGVIYGG